MSVSRLVVKWFAGLLLGTLIIAVTSPLFVRSYLPQDLDPVRECYVPVSGRDYRWRSEGYATTAIGEHGMPGRRQVPPTDPGSARVALWGDSQAEGVCVSDQEKLFAQLQRAAAADGKPMTVLPFARSGENASHWLTQMPSVEDRLEIDVHVWVIVDLPDLLAAANAPLHSPMYEQRIRSQSKIAAIVPAFLIQAARHLLTDEEGNQRRLRFSVGPAKREQPDKSLEEAVDWNAVWQTTMKTIRDVSDRPIVIGYAPRSPHISGGKIVLHDSQDEQFVYLERAAVAAGLLVVDTRDALADAARDGRWPHGFHNGQIGDGHLNAVGNQVIAEMLSKAVFRSAK